MKFNDIIGAKIMALEKALPIVEEWKKMGDKVVFTNGCFDLLHKGHVQYLADAADLGDRLIIGLNSDNSVTRLKGPGRPLQDESARASVLASLLVTDLIIFFGEDTPLDLIQSLSPDVLVKGGDYNISDIVGADHVISTGGEVKTIEIVQGYSTSDIETRIRNQAK